jgi:hypothetical protein
LFDDCAVRAQLPELTIAASSQNPVAISPTTPWCHVQTPYLTQAKGFGSYRIPKIDVQVSAGIQSSPGVEVAANFNATNAFTQPSLGRALSGGVSNVSVNLVSPGTLYGDRVNQVDLRVGKTFKFAGRGRLNTNVDLYNVFNANPATQQQNNFSTTVFAPTATAWQAPQAVLPARIVKISAQFDF